MFRIFFLLGFFSAVSVVALPPVEPIIITNQQLKINGEQRLYYALEAGDALLIDLTLLKGKQIKSLEVIAYPDQSKFSATKIEELKDKTIRIFERGIYEFRIQAGGNKTVQLCLKRIPASPAKKNFDTTVKWKTVRDTIRKNYTEKTKVRYDTAWVNKQRKTLVKIDTVFTSIADRQERVISMINKITSSDNKLYFQIPNNKIEALDEKRVIGWSYWIGVGQEGLDNYNKELRMFLLKISGKVASKNLMAGIALGTYALAVNPPKGDNINYTITLDENTISTGNVTSSFGRETEQLQGKIGLELYNDNILNGVNVGIKILVAQSIKKYKLETYQERVVTPIKELETKGKVKIVSTQIPYID
jgi:hypothetical protein